jgi:DNA-binding PadR family transcriptional regulator
MKGLFLFSRAAAEGRIAEPRAFDFGAMSFGPCSPAIYSALDRVVDGGLVRADPVEGETWSRYAITDLGRDRVREAQTAEPASADFLRRIRQWCDRQSFSDLLRAVYRAYPEFAVNSVLPHLRPN